MYAWHFYGDLIKPLHHPCCLVLSIALIAVPYDFSLGNGKHWPQDPWRRGKQLLLPFSKESMQSYFLFNLYQNISRTLTDNCAGRDWNTRDANHQPSSSRLSHVFCMTAFGQCICLLWLQFLLFPPLHTKVQRCLRWLYTGYKFSYNHNPCNQSMNRSSSAISLRYHVLPV